jgi:hypothetical protein
VTRHQYPLKWALSEIDKLNEIVEELKKEIARLDQEKAGKRGPKKN